MSTTDSEPEPRRKRRWLQFSLRTLLVLMLLASVGMSCMAVKLQRLRKQREATETGVTAIKSLGGEVAYDWRFDASGNLTYQQPEWLRSLLGEEVLGRGLYSVTFHGAVGLEHLKRLNRLCDLNLAGSEVSDQDLKHLDGCCPIGKIDLHGTSITDAGLEQLANVRGLYDLILSNTQVSDAGLDHLKTSIHLHYLDVRGTRVTEEGVRRLQQALLKCEITR